MAGCSAAVAAAAVGGRGSAAAAWVAVVAASVARSGLFAVGSALVKAMRFLVEVDLKVLVDLFSMSVSSLLVVKWTGFRKLTNQLFLGRAEPKWYG